MTAREVQRLDDESERARVRALAAGGDQHAVLALVLWSHWRKIRHLDVPAKKKTLMLGNLIEFMDKNVQLEVTYG